MNSECHSGMKGYYYTFKAASGDGGCIFMQILLTSYNTSLTILATCSLINFPIFQYKLLQKRHRVKK